MSATVNEERVELIVEGEVFWGRVNGMNDNDELRWLGLEPFDMIGGFNENDGPTLVNFCAANHEYHIVTYTSEDRYVNRYVPGQSTYRLATGDKNPYLVYNPWVNPLRRLVVEDFLSQLDREADDIDRRRKL